MTTENSLRGKKARADGVKFELKVRRNLEANGWIVDKWNNNVDLDEHEGVPDFAGGKVETFTMPQPKLIIAKRKYNPHKKVMAIGVGFPDFICFKLYNVARVGKEETIVYEVIGVEAKSAKYLDKEEKAKVKWLLDNKIFSKILVAYKGENGEILYTGAGGEKDDKLL